MNLSYLQSTFPVHFRSSCGEVGVREPRVLWCERSSTSMSIYFGRVCTAFSFLNCLFDFLNFSTFEKNIENHSCSFSVEKNMARTTTPAGQTLLSISSAHPSNENKKDCCRFSIKKNMPRTTTLADRLY